MLTLDTQKIAEHKAAEQLFRTREVTLHGTQNETRDAGLVEHRDSSVANPERQAGKKLSPTEFMAKLRKVNPDIILEPHPGVSAPKNTAFHRLNKDKACLHLVIGDVKKFLLVCEGDYMPEWTVMTTKKIKAPEGNYVQGLWKMTPIPWNIEKRGWREVLIWLIRMKVVSLEPVERIFGVGDRKSWKTLTAKGPWE